MMPTVRALLLRLALVSAPLPAPWPLVGLESTQGSQFLAAQPAGSAAWALLAHFETQGTQSFCSVATAAVMLNAIGTPAPTDPVFAPYPYFTQANMLGECAERIQSHKPGLSLSAGFIATHGSTLDEWRAYVSCHAPGAVRVHASGSSAVEFRAQALSALNAKPPSAVGLNFHRSGLGEVGGGHMSPIGAYDETTDSFLLLDVSRYKYPAVWASTSALFAAMNTTDGASNLSRGWLGVPPPPAASRGAGGAASEAQRPSFAAVRACIGALRRGPTDGHGVLACMADPSFREPPLDAAMMAALLVGGAALGAALTLGAQASCARYRRGQEARVRLMRSSETATASEMGSPSSWAAGSVESLGKEPESGPAAPAESAPET